ncbi:MAG: type II/IV secretion system ATPase subunit [Dehalococcoidales bacterium]|nr:type II/IV secretion system ATPase subunit [Dehalococcoidales bacterium]
MAQTVLPFSKFNKADNDDLSQIKGDILQSLPPDLKERAEARPYLLEYLQLAANSKIAMPQYHHELSRKLGDNKTPNLIYPTKNKDIYVHILADNEDSRNSYIPIEPSVTVEVGNLLKDVEKKLLELGTKLKRIDPDGNKEEQFLRYIEQATTVKKHQETGLFEKYFGFLAKGGSKLSKITVTQRELEGVRYLFVRDKVGLGSLEALIVDPYIEDISCSGMGTIFVEHKIFKSLKSSIVFSNVEELDEFVLWLAERVKKPVTYKNPISDATLPDGSRINVVFGHEVSKRGSNFTIRKFSDVPISVFELVDFGTVNYQMLAYLSLMIANGMNVFVSGETASGKTTLLNAITSFIHPLAKVVSIEDTPELQVPHKNWVREVVQSSKSEDPSGAVTMFDLLKAALRQRPNEIIVGEIRGSEGNIAFQAMQTGHAVMATFHAATTEKLIQRITGNPISVPKTYIDNLNIVILTSQVRLPNGKNGRRITGINEIVGYDPVFDSFTFVESFHWDEATDKFEFTGNMSSYILENKIAPKLGYPTHQKRRIYAELERRAKILQKLHKEMGVTGFYEVLEVLGRAQREGLF